MFMPTRYDSRKYLQICERIFVTGEYFPHSETEVERLQSLGFELQQGKLVLPAGIDYLDQAYIEQELHGFCATSQLKHIELMHCVESTNQELLNLAHHRDISGVIVLTELQIAGRGRFGRNWHSPVGRNLAVSLGAKVSRTPCNPGAISLVVGVAVANAIQEIGVDSVALKWPNDILLDGRKAGGILVDLLHPTSPFEFVIGIGLNVGGVSSYQEVIDYPVADLLDYCAFPIRNKLLVLVVRNIYESLRSFEHDGFQSFYEKWGALDALRGKIVTVNSQQDQIQGIARDVRHTGELCIELPDGTIHHVIAGEVSLKEAR